MSGQPFPERADANKAAFVAGDSKAVAELRAAGVRFLVLDTRYADEMRDHEPDHPVVYMNDSLTIVGIE